MVQPLDLTLPYNIEAARAFLASELIFNISEISPNQFFQLEQHQIIVREDLISTFSSLPLEWSDYFSKFIIPSSLGELAAGESRSQLLKDLSNCVVREEFPESLKDFLGKLSKFSLKRETSEEPILSHNLPLTATSSIGPISPPAAPRPSSETPNQSSNLPKNVEQKVKQRKNSQNATRAGLSPKKLHEVERFTKLVQKMILEGSITSTGALDIGAGRAHLSRALTLHPLNLSVLALDWDPQQKSGAGKLDQQKAQLISKNSTGILTHETCSLDSTSISEFTNGNDSTLVGLHACGDLTVNILRSRCEEDSKRAMIVVGCCYTHLSPSSFPLSNQVSSALQDFKLSRQLLFLSSQSPATWFLTRESTQSFNSSIRKIMYRARFGAELDSIPEQKDGEEIKIGKIAECRSYEDYRRVAIEKTGFAESLKSLGDVGLADPVSAQFYVEVYWILKSLIGGVVESLIILDRYLYLVENLPEASIGVIALFEQSISLRNLAIVVS